MNYVDKQSFKKIFFPNPHTGFKKMTEIVLLFQDFFD